MPTNESALNTAHVQKDFDRAQELRVLERNTGTSMPKEPLLITGTCLVTDMPGMCLYQTGGTAFTKADPAVPSKMPAVVLITEKTGDTSFAGRLLSATDEVKVVSGLTAGSTYVVGSDGYPAKSGDSNYPAAGSQIQVIGRALGSSLLLLTPGIGGSLPGQGGGASSNFSTADGSPYGNLTTETTLATSSIAANAVQAGQWIDVPFAVNVTAGHTTDTLTLKVKAGSTVLLTSPAYDVVNTGELITGRLSLYVRAGGASGKAVVGAVHVQAGTATAGATATAGEISLDFTAAISLTLTGAWSVADAGNSCKAQLFGARISA